MKRFGGVSATFGAAVLLLLFGSTLPTQAYQEEHPQEEHPQDAKPKPSENAKPPANAKPPENGKPHDEATKPSEDAAKPTPTKPAAKEEKTSKEASAPGSKNTRETETVKQSDTRAETKSTVKHGPIENGRIPDAQFHSNFGREHTFHVGHPVVVEGQSRFQFGDYWFGFGEPWPVGWADTDDVYVDYIDGQYYLIDPVHPGLRLALVVVI
jgi:hypothetical protein